MKTRLSIFVLFGVLTGCSHFSLIEPSKLDQAVAMLEIGRTAGAVKLLTEISKEKPVKGVTDEALFRLGLLNLRQGGDNDTSLAILMRLQKEYPTSSWTRNAAPLLEVVMQYEEVRNQNKNLKNANQTLGKENRELLQNIEKLKSLDLELERKITGK